MNTQFIVKMSAFYESAIVMLDDQRLMLMDRQFDAVLFHGFYCGGIVTCTSS